MGTIWYLCISLVPSVARTPVASLAPMLALPQAVDGRVHGHRTTAEIEVSKFHQETQGDPRKNPELYW